VNKMKKKNRKSQASRDVKFFYFTCLLALCSAVLFFVSSLGLKVYNNSLSIQKQSIDSQIADIQTQNDTLQVEIRQLASADRVNEVAASTGMSYNQNNITTVTDGTDKN
jgi:cell division protein FtsL